jgi:hypothetical protein
MAKHFSYLWPDPYPSKSIKSCIQPSDGKLLTVVPLISGTFFALFQTDAIPVLSSRSSFCPPEWFDYWPFASAQSEWDKREDSETSTQFCITSHQNHFAIKTKKPEVETPGVKWVDYWYKSPNWFTQIKSHIDVVVAPTIKIIICKWMRFYV